MSFKSTYDGLKDLLELYFRGGYRDFKIVLLLGGEALSESSTIADVLSLELLNGGGYSRQPVTFNASGIDGVLKAIKFPQEEVEFEAADSLPLQFDAIALIAGGATTANKVVSTIAGSPSTFTITAHGLVAGDRIFFTNEDASAPSDLTLGQFYYVISSGLTANDFRVATAPGGSALTFGTTWSGQLVCRYAKGAIVAFELRNDDGAGNRVQTINPGQSHTVPVLIGLRAGS